MSSRYPTTNDAAMARRRGQNASVGVPTGEPEHLDRVPDSEKATGELTAFAKGKRGLVASGTNRTEREGISLEGMSTTERQISAIPAGRLKYPNVIKSPIPPR